MDKEIFEKKCREMGDFYMYYQKQDKVAFAICTLDLDNHHIQSKLHHTKVSEDMALLWNWRYDSALRVKYSAIKKLTPLGAVLKNYR